MKKSNTQLTAPIQRALIYCRVSDKKQRTEGSGLDSQEHRCREYAERKSYSVEAVFPDDITGGGDFMKRPGMVALLAYLDARPDERYVVIFDDLKRYARDTEFHLKLRRIMAERNATRECLNFNFEDTEEGKFFETIVAAQSELERAQNARQTRQKMRARVDQGYYIFGEPPLGYVYDKEQGGGKILVPSEPNATIVREAFEGLASGRYQNTTEIQRFFASKPSTITRKKGKPRNWQSVNGLLRSEIYAGYFSVKAWGIEFKKGKHEPLVSLETWRKAQDRLDGRVNAPARKDFNEDFPLRGFVECACCNSPMTAAWSKGRNSYYPYYFCQEKGCEVRGKSIRKEKIESDFEAFLGEMQPCKCLYKLAYAMMKDRWDAVLSGLNTQVEKSVQAISDIEKKTAKLVSLIMDTDSSALISAYEAEVKKLEKEKLRLTENMTSAVQPRHSFEQTYRTACKFLANPYKLWVSSDLKHKRMVLRLAFRGRVPYCRKEGYRTAQIAEPLRLLRHLSDRNGGMVGVTGIEPVTPTMST